MKYLTYALVPLLVLLTSIVASCLLAYVIALIFDNPDLLRNLIIRITQVFLLLSIFPTMAIMNLSKEDLGFCARTQFLKQFPKGFLLGLLTLLPVFIVLYAIDINVFDEMQPWSIGFAAKKIILSFLLALLVALIEESIFRGVLLTGLKKKMPAAAAVLISSAYFAALHFLHTKSAVPADQFGLSSGFVLLADAFDHMINPKNLSAFISLLAVGAFLAVIRTEVKTGLGLCIGCHTAWVWQIKMSGTLFNTNITSEYLYLVSSYNFVVGPLVTVWLSLAIAGYYLYKNFIRRPSVVINTK